MDVAVEDVEYLDDLVLYIKSGRVVPVVGPELVTVEHEGATIPLDRYLALRLADRLRVNRAGLPNEFTLSDVVAAYTSGRGRLGDVPPRLLTILSERDLPAPEALRKLARIRPLQLFVTTTFDSLLLQAINDVRFGGNARTRQLAYAPNRVQDLEAGWQAGSTPTVFHLFGQASAERNFVITEEDLLEFLHALQSESRRPTTLFDELDQHDLLFIGCRFPDWLARFVLRTTRRSSLSPQRDRMEVVADASAARDASLAVFLDQFSRDTKVFPGDAAAFVDALVARWAERFPAEVVADAPANGPTPAPGAPGSVAPSAAPNGATGAAAIPAGVMRPGSVFISYASEDRAAAERLCEQLSVTVDVWLDKQELHGGVDWDIMIRQNIRQCALFIPVVSRHAAARVEGYFRREWAEALRRAEGIDQTVRPFIVPVAIDDIPNNAPGIPNDFWTRHVERLDGGALSDGLREQVKTLVRRFHQER